MQQKVEIVPAAEADLPEILSLAKAAFPDPWTEQQFRQTMCCCYSRIWCARAAGEFCGYVAVSLAGDAVNLDDIAIVPAFRRRVSADSFWTGHTGVSGERILAGSAGVQRRRYCPV